MYRQRPGFRKWLSGPSTLLGLLGLVVWLLLGVGCRSQAPVSLAVSPGSAVFTAIDLREQLQAAGSEQMAWKIVRRLNSFEGYHNFLLLYPDGENAARAREQLLRYEPRYWQEVEWALQTQARSRDYLLFEYLNLFPEGAHYAEAKTRYDALPDNARWYTLEFNDRDRAGVVFGVPLPLDSLRLSGLVEYLQAQPKGILADWVTEKLVRTYISALFLPQLPERKGQEVLVTPRELAQLQDGLEGISSLNPAQRKLADAYLRDILLRDAAFRLEDDNGDSIIDELEIEESIRLQREQVLFPDKISELEELDETLPSGVLRPTPPSGIDDVVKVRPPAVGEKTQDRPPQPPAPQEEPVTIAEMAERSLSSLGRGRYAYDPIPVLPVDSAYFFRLTIIPLIDSLLTPDEARPGREIPISSEMSVRILPANPEAFSIRAVSDSIQPVDLRDSTTWSWFITPRIVGRHEVVISIDIITRGTNIDQTLRRSITVATETVEVIATATGNPPEEPSSLFAFSPYWWFLLLLPAGLLLWFFWWRRRRRQGRSSILLREGSDDDLIEQIEAERSALRDMEAELQPLLDQAEQTIARGDTGQALDDLLDFFRRRQAAIYTELLSLSAQYRQYQRSFNMGLKPDDSIPNRINLAVLQLISYIRNVVEEV